jgi:hypothetical protein
VNTKLQREIGLIDSTNYGWLVTANDTMLNYTFRENKLHGFVSYSKKLSRRSTLQAGINIDLYMMDYQDSVRQFDGVTGVLPPWRKQWNTQAAWPVIQPYLSYKTAPNFKGKYIYVVEHLLTDNGSYIKQDNLFSNRYLIEK